MFPNYSSEYPLYIGIDFSSSQFEGPLPVFSSNTTSLNLSNNQFIGSISVIFKIMRRSLSFLDLSGNQLTGQVPGEIGYMTSLTSLNLSLLLQLLLALVHFIVLLIFSLVSANMYGENGGTTIPISSSPPPFQPRTTLQAVFVSTTQHHTPSSTPL